jgi:hypothetical protein
MRWFGLFLACLPLLVLGCRRESSPPPSVQTAVTAPPSPRGSHPSDTSTVSTAISDSGNAEANLRQLTQALRDHVVRTKSVPKNFEEFAAKAQLNFPPPPPGKKYEIQGQEVVLVKR